MMAIMSTSRKVKVFYVGGTMGMLEDELGTLHPSPLYLGKSLSEMPELKSSMMPGVDIEEYDCPVDSSDMDSNDWVRIARDIEKVYSDYDGFVVLQGTDTMAYTATALSFMLENLSKTVVFTGSMIPMSKGYSDARRNLLISVDIAANSSIPEVCLYFNNKLIRGNRAVKKNSSGMDAFDSPNHPPLAAVGVGISYYSHLFRSTSSLPLVVNTTIDPGVVSFRLIPGFDDSIIGLLGSISAVKACVIAMYGTGNAPSRKHGLLNALRQVIKSGKLVVIVSQCLVGKVDLTAYNVGRQLAEIGCISGMDMTLEAVAIKLGYLFGLGMSGTEVANQLGKNLRGEVTS